MARVLAVHEIQRTVSPGKAATLTSPAVPPVVETIVPGTIFMTKDDDEYRQLREAGAVRVPEKGEKLVVNFEDMPTMDTKPAEVDAAEIGRQAAEAELGRQAATSKAKQTRKQEKDAAASAERSSASAEGTASSDSVSTDNLV